METKKQYLPPCLQAITLKTEDLITTSPFEDGVMIDGSGLWGGSTNNQGGFEEQ